MSVAEHPWYTRRCWRIHGGEAVELDIHAAVPPGVCACFAAGVIRQDREAWGAARVTSIVTRCVPWATAWLGPRLGVYGGADGWSEPWGYAVGSGCMLLRGELRPDLLVETAHHEVWHLVSKRLPPRALAVVDAEVATGDLWDGCAYLGEPDERRARAYARFAALADEGFEHVRRPGSAAAVYWDVYTGQAGQELDLRVAA